VSNLSANSNIRRFVFVVMNGRRTGAPLSELQRGYFTLRLPEAGGRRTIKLQGDTKLKEHLAIRLPAEVPEPAIAIASVLWIQDSSSQRQENLRKHKSGVRLQNLRQQPSWVIHLHCHNRCLANVLSYLRLPPILESTVLLTVDSLTDMYFQVYLKIRRQENEAIEKLFRGGIELLMQAELELLTTSRAESEAEARASERKSSYFARSLYFSRKSRLSKDFSGADTPRDNNRRSLKSLFSASAGVRRRSSVREAKAIYLPVLSLRNEDSLVRLDETVNLSGSSGGRRSSRRSSSTVSLEGKRKTSTSPQ
jgi:hypothetical protein